ncbi:MAG: hypothetical protein LBO04_01920 [Spirochaetaceae bacterium]|jgi:hypothetical protein|nr:hypothetical protein [Spirochaetaceae bacterium]
MKKLLFLCGAFVLAANFASAQQIPPGWDINPPKDTAGLKYQVGVSLPSATEQEAFKGAWQNALQNFASSIATRVESLTSVSVREEGYDSDIADAYPIQVETSSFSTRVPLSGVREAARKIEHRGGAYTARVLAAMSDEDYQKALRYIENEEAAFLAYRFFEQKAKGVTRLSGNRPAGYADFYSWLRDNCVTISFAGTGGQAEYLGQTEIFCKKLYRGAVVFAGIIDGNPARVIYDSPRHYDGIVRALQDFGMFTIKKENAALVLTPGGRSSPAAFRSAVADMKDGSKICGTGIEVIQTENGDVLKSSNLVIPQFITAAARQFGLNAVRFNLPGEYTNSAFLDEAAIIGYINANVKSFPARFVAIVFAGTRLSPGVAAYNVPPSITASARFTLYDVLTGETVSSAEADTRGFVFSPANSRQQTVVAESRRALQFLYDPKNKPGLAGIMADVLGK